jgi:molybdenum cofactor biosynthesis enzyme MoaA
MTEFASPSDFSITTVQSRVFGQQFAAKLGGRRLPLSGQWELTCRCNLRCVMCYTDCFNTPERIQQELGLSEILRIMDQIEDAGCLNLCLTGGEPLARKDFLDIYAYAKQKGFLLTVFTNGTLVTPKIADSWVKLPPSMIEISLHGLFDAFDEITQASGSYERCMTGIRLILERNLPLTLKTTGMTINRDEILKIKGYVDRLGDSYRTKVWYKFGSEIRPTLDGSEEVFRYQLPAPDVIAIEKADPEFQAERAKQDDALAETLRQGDELCGSITSRFHIDAYGQLQLCSANRRRSYDLRRGSFQEGFYKFLPQFPCANRQSQHQPELVNIDRSPLQRMTIEEVV